VINSLAERGKPQKGASRFIGRLFGQLFFVTFFFCKKKVRKEEKSSLNLEYPKIYCLYIMPYKMFIKGSPSKGGEMYN
jgi:hypothetical protein